VIAPLSVALLASAPGGALGHVPGGPPVLVPSALSFKHSLKTHLTRRRSRSLGPRHARSIVPNPASLPINSRWTRAGSGPPA